MVKNRIALGHVSFSDEVDKAVIDLNANLPPLTFVKDVKSFFGYCGFIMGFSKIANPLSKLLVTDLPF